MHTLLNNLHEADTLVHRDAKVHGPGSPHPEGPSNQPCPPSDASTQRACRGALQGVRSQQDR
jgi:hypothetical protein